MDKKYKIISLDLQKSLDLAWVMGHYCILVKRIKELH